MLSLQGNWQAAVRLFAALVLLLGAIAPSWHQANANAYGDLAQLQLLLGEPLDSLQDSICHHDGGGDPSSLPDSDPASACKHCPLCVVFQHLPPPVPQRSFAGRAYDESALVAFLPYRSELKAVRETPDQGRPRAPPPLV